MRSRARASRSAYESSSYASPREQAEEDTSDSKLIAGVLLALGAGALAYAAYKSWMAPPAPSGRLGATPVRMLAPPALTARAPIALPSTPTTAFAPAAPAMVPPPIQVLTSPPVTPLTPSTQQTFPTHTFTTQPAAPQNPPSLTLAPPTVSTNLPPNPSSPAAPPVVSTTPLAPSAPPVLTLTPSGPATPPGAPPPGVDTGTIPPSSIPGVPVLTGGGGGGGPIPGYPYDGSTVLPSGGNPQPNPCVPCDAPAGACPPSYDRAMASAAAGGAIPTSGGGTPPMSAIRDGECFGIGAPPSEEATPLVDCEERGAAFQAALDAAPKPTVAPRLYWPD